MSTGIAPGGLVARFVAQMVDSIVVVMVFTACAVASVWIPLQSEAALVIGIGAGMFLLAWVVFCWWSGAERAATPGMRLMELELVDFSDGTAIGWGRFFARALAYAVLSLTGIGLIAMVIWLIRDEYGRGWHDKLAGAIVVERILPNREPAPGPEPEPVSVDDDVTRVRRPLPGAAAASRSDTWSVRLDDGRCVPVAPQVLIGRAPLPGPGEESAALVEVGEGARTVSKTHLLVGVDEQGVYAMDHGSTNGSAISLPGNQYQLFPAGRRVRLGSGQVVLFGEHWLEVLCRR